MVSYQGAVIVKMWASIQKLSDVSFPAMPQIEPHNLELTAQYLYLQEAFPSLDTASPRKVVVSSNLDLHRALDSPAYY